MSKKDIVAESLIACVYFNDNEWLDYRRELNSTFGVKIRRDENTAYFLTETRGTKNGKTYINRQIHYPIWVSTTFDVAIAPISKCSSIKWLHGGYGPEVLNKVQAMVTSTRRKYEEARLVCDCNKGYASAYDGLCKFCREGLISRAQAKKVNVRSRGDGLSIDQYRCAIGELKRNEVWI